MLQFAQYDLVIFLRHGHRLDLFAGRLPETARRHLLRLRSPSDSIIFVHVFLYIAKAGYHLQGQRVTPTCDSDFCEYPRLPRHSCPDEYDESIGKVWLKVGLHFYIQGMLVEARRSGTKSSDIRQIFDQTQSLRLWRSYSVTI